MLTSAPVDHDQYDDAYIRGILDEVKTIAVVGASPNTVRPSYFVVKYLIDKGYTVFPINPGKAGETILGRPVHASIHDVPEPLDMIDVFRNSEAAGGILDDALTLDPLPKIGWVGVNSRTISARRPKLQGQGFQHLGLRKDVQRDKR